MLCINGEPYDKLIMFKICGRISRYIQVFARTSPSQKGITVSLLNNEGHTTLMCGDGTNDVGSLKRADVGLAIVNGVAPAKAGCNGAHPKLSVKVRHHELFSLDKFIVKHGVSESRLVDELGQLGLAVSSDHLGGSLGVSLLHFISSSGLLNSKNFIQLVVYIYIFKLALLHIGGLACLLMHGANGCGDL